MFKTDRGCKRIWVSVDEYGVGRSVSRERTDTGGGAGRRDRFRRAVVLRFYDCKRSLDSADGGSVREAVGPSHENLSWSSNSFAISSICSGSRSSMSSPSNRCLAPPIASAPTTVSFWSVTGAATPQYPSTCSSLL